ncbi:hypothetical protein DSO57_1008152 [Entomophthora muscae]|uniref:Uncharacterized protein n=1 Tax=Entomophthora muscae TaxID=34485 RepID=A0ACC2SJY5_9FUNG|nr:hypothetical protein DSO57_1008152 [Entomophthora muscae]
MESCHKGSFSQFLRKNGYGKLLGSDIVVSSTAIITLRISMTKRGSGNSSCVLLIPEFIQEIVGGLFAYLRKVKETTDSAALEQVNDHQTLTRSF